MFSFDHKIRVRYAETDQMGFAYYGNYSAYYEEARAEALRSLGFSYRELEAMGVMMPVYENHSKYLKPARYDDLLRINVLVKEKPSAKMTFHYEIYNESSTLIHIGKSILVFVDKTMWCTQSDESIIQPIF